MVERSGQRKHTTSDDEIGSSRDATHSGIKSTEFIAKHAPRLGRGHDPLTNFVRDDDDIGGRVQQCIDQKRGAFSQSHHRIIEGCIAGPGVLLVQHTSHPQRQAVDHQSVGGGC